VRALVYLLRIYRWTLSPLLGPVCRFHPSCSRYAEDCLLTHGLFHGTILAIKRLAKCHPFHPGGYDPVPPRNHRQRSEPERPRSEKPSDNDTFVLAVTSQGGLP
jgi:uncharacterized protein